MLRRSDFLACYDRGWRYHAKGFILFVLDRSTPSDHWRLGLAVSRKVGHAATRNRIKRLLREFFRLHGPMVPGGIDVVAVPKKQLDVHGLTLEVLTKDLEPILGKIQASQDRRPARTTT